MLAIEIGVLDAGDALSVVAAKCFLNRSWRALISRGWYTLAVTGAS
jgi:hypothetical protein